MVVESVVNNYGKEVEVSLVDLVDDSKRKAGSGELRPRDDRAQLPVAGLSGWYRLAA